jgi:3'(2'), 5'-bisphosphate nucleotidase
MRYEHERMVAIEAVIKACCLCQSIRKTYLPDDVREKEDRSPVTIADLSAQAVISLDLFEIFSHDAIAAEEGLAGLGDDIKEKVVLQVKNFFPALGPEKIFTAIERCAYEGGSRGRFWVLDPVDGTKGFIRGEQYAIALALVEEGEVVLGVLGCPNLPGNLDKPDGSRGSIFVAAKGQGSVMRYINDSAERKIKVANSSDFSQALFYESFERAHSSHNHAARIAEVLGIKKPPVRMDSQGKYGIVARGEATIYLRLPTKKGYEEKIWDHAAGWLIVKEAEGEVTDIQGKPLDFSQGRTLSQNYGVVATNGKLHSQVLSAIKKVYETP